MDFQPWYCDLIWNCLWEIFVNFTELSVRHTSVFLFPDDTWVNINRFSRILVLALILWFGITNGQISPIYDNYLSAIRLYFIYLSIYLSIFQFSIYLSTLPWPKRAPSSPPPPPPPPPHKQKKKKKKMAETTQTETTRVDTTRNLRPKQEYAAPIWNPHPQSFNN